MKADYACSYVRKTFVQAPLRLPQLQWYAAHFLRKSAVNIKLIRPAQLFLLSSTVFHLTTAIFPFVVFKMRPFSQPRDIPVYEALAPLVRRTQFPRNSLRVGATPTTSCFDFADINVNTQPVMWHVFCTIVRQVAQMLLPSNSDGLVDDLHWARNTGRCMRNSFLKGVTAFSRVTVEENILYNSLCSPLLIADDAVEDSCVTEDEESAPKHVSRDPSVMQWMQVLFLIFMGMKIGHCCPLPQRSNLFGKLDAISAVLAPMETFLTMGICLYVKMKENEW